MMPDFARRRRREGDRVVGERRDFIESVRRMRISAEDEDKEKGDEGQSERRC